MSDLQQFNFQKSTVIGVFAVTYNPETDQMQVEQTVNTDKMAESKFIKLFKEFNASNDKKQKSNMKKPVNYCECGKKAVVKNRCNACYKRAIYPRKKPIEHPFITNNIYELVFNEVKKGHTIDRACKIVGTDRTVLYRNMSPIQKAELYAQKYLVEFEDEAEA